MNHGTFPIILQKEEEGGYSVSNPALEGCYSQGETIEEALQNIKEATLLCLEDEMAPATQKEVSLHLVTVQSYAEAPETIWGRIDTDS